LPEYALSIYVKVAGLALHSLRKQKWIFYYLARHQYLLYSELIPKTSP